MVGALIHTVHCTYVMVESHVATMERSFSTSLKFLKYLSRDICLSLCVYSCSHMPMYYSMYICTYIQYLQRDLCAILSLCDIQCSVL